MQKARRHCTQQLRPLVGAWFQGLFHSSVRGAFHLSFTVLVRYRSLGECRYDMQKAWYAISQLQYKLGVSILVDINKRIIIFNWVNSNEVERITYEIENNLLKERDRIKRSYKPG